MKKNEKTYSASALIVSLLVLGAIVVTALSVSLVSIKERSISSNASKSSQAFQNADSGVEAVMYEITKRNHSKVSEIRPTGTSCTNKKIVGNNYKVELLDTTGNVIDCSSNSKSPSDVATIKSVGSDSAGRTQRAISAAVAAGGGGITGEALIIGGSVVSNNYCNNTWGTASCGHSGGVIDWSNTKCNDGSLQWGAGNYADGRQFFCVKTF